MTPSATIIATHQADSEDMRISEPTLVVDGSSPSTFVGLLAARGEWLARVSRKVAPLEGLFPMVETALHSAECKLSNVNGFIYCEGPGSVLGLRICAMAIQTWGYLSKPKAEYFHYNSLELTAALIVLDETELTRALLISDWKKDTWHSIEINQGNVGTITSINDQTVREWNEGPLFYLPQRKGWQRAPANAITLEYSPHRLPEATHLLRATKTIELYASNMSVFQKWVPQHHRAKP